MKPLVILIAVGGLSLAQTAAAQDAVRVGTSSVGSVFYTLAVGVSEIITKHAKVNATAEPVGGSAANMRGLAAKNIEFAIGNAFAAFTAYKGTDTFKKPIDLRLVVQGQPSYRWFVLRKASGIKRVEDLKGKTIVAKRRALPELTLIMDALISVTGLSKGDVKRVETTNTGQVLQALKAGSIDGAVFPFSRRAPHVQEPMTDGMLDFLYVSKDVRDAMLKRLPPMMWDETFKPGVFKGQDKPLHLIGLNTYFLTRPGVSDDTAYKVAKAIYENTKEFASYHRTAAQWNLKRALKNVALPFHNGVIRYFREKGVWTAALDARQKELLKR
jgi:hypothetical protein